MSSSIPPFFAPLVTHADQLIKFSGQSHLKSGPLHSYCFVEDQDSSFESIVDV